jgi:tetratricopeptide (TPR) repeat protein
MTTSRRFLGAVFSVLLVAGMVAVGHPGAARAAGGGGDDSKRGPSGASESPDYTAAVKAIKAGQFPAAIRLLEGVVGRESKNADAYNWLAYATRRNGNPAAAIPIYERALAIDPGHRGAHEYMGEAYLALNDLARAKEHLARLDALCFLPCSEYRELKEAVQAYEKSGGKVKPTATR